MTDDRTMDHGTAIRQLMRRLPQAALGTLLVDSTGAPYVSLVMVALDHDATPLLLLSDLADHTQNLKADPRVSLLFDGTGGTKVPLASERATIQGRAVRTDDPLQRARYLARHPDAAACMQFRDFNLYRVEIDRAHLVAGFGRIHWLEGRAVRLSDADALRQAEAGIVAHMNEDHTDAIQLYACILLAQEGQDWRLTGADPEGVDLRRESTGGTSRLPFSHIARTPEDVRAELVRLAKQARRGEGRAAIPDVR